MRKNFFALVPTTHPIFSDCPLFVYIFVCNRRNQTTWCPICGQMLLIFRNESVDAQGTPNAPLIERFYRAFCLSFNIVTPVSVDRHIMSSRCNPAFSPLADSSDLLPPDQTTGMAGSPDAPFTLPTDWDAALGSPSVASSRTVSPAKGASAGSSARRSRCCG